MGPKAQISSQLAILGITRMFRGDQAGRDELIAKRDAFPYEEFDLLAYTAGNDAEAGGRGPNNNLLSEEAITVDNVVTFLGGNGARKRGFRVPVVDKYMVMASCCLCFLLFHILSQFNWGGRLL